MLKYFPSILICALLVGWSFTISTVNAATAITTEIATEQRNKQIIVWIFIAILFSWLAACLGRTKSWWLGGVIGFLFGLFIWWISRIWFFMPLLGITGFAYDYLVSRNYKKYSTCEKGAFWCTPSELEQIKRIEEDDVQ